MNLVAPDIVIIVVAIALIYLVFKPRPCPACGHEQGSHYDEGYRMPNPGCLAYVEGKWEMGSDGWFHPLPGKTCRCKLSPAEVAYNRKHFKDTK